MLTITTYAVSLSKKGSVCIYNFVSVSGTQHCDSDIEHSPCAIQ